MQSELNREEQRPAFEKSKGDKAAFEQLIGLAIQGEKEALANLCRLIARGVLFRTSYILRQQMDAEDAAQETLIRVCKSIHNLSDPKAFGAWLDRIIINETRRVAAKNSKYEGVLSLHEYLDTTEDEFEEDSVEFLPHEFIAREETRRAVMEIVESLPKRQREAVLLHYCDGLSVTETASVMEVAKTNVSHYLKFAREKVRDMIEKQVGGTETAAYGMGLLPIGPLLTQTLRANADMFVSGDGSWVQQAISKGATLSAGKTAAASGSVGAVGSMKFMGVFIVLAIVAVTALGAWLSVISTDAKAPDTNMPPAQAEGRVVMDGEGEDGFINPSQATAQVDAGQCDMTALEWRITAAGSDEVLYSGDGGVVESAFTDLRERGGDGEYLLKFDVTDTPGDRYTLSCNFFIRTG